MQKGCKTYLSENKELMPEWDWEANEGLNPNKITCGSHIKAWWKCSKCGYKWQTIIQSRALGHSGCPACANKVCVQGINDLATTHPDIAKEWHPTKNGDLKPTDVVAGSKWKVWWKCPIGHEYRAYVYARKNTGCSICNSRQKTSFPEQAIFYYIKKLYPNSLNKYKDCFNDQMEFDIYIPEIKTAIEYDGARWHKTDSEHKREIRKYEFCKKNEIYLIRIKEHKDKSWDDTADKLYSVPVIKARNFHVLDQVIYALLEEIGKPKQLDLEINIEKDKNEIMNYLSKIENSLAEKCPDVAAKWNYEKNGNLTPAMFSVSSASAVWWKCPDCGNEWKAHINDVVRNTYGCPECSKIQRGKTFRKLCIKQKGSLADNMPELAKEWHLTKNVGLTPCDVTVGCDTVVWWKCSKCEHEWQTAVKDRALGHCGCPACANKVCVQGINDLATTYPDTAKEWHPTKNGDLKPTDVVAGSKWKVWWKCSKCGHEWQAVVASRALRCSGCPECVKIQKGQAYVEFCIKKKGSLADNMPELAKEWHPTKNGDLKPSDISVGSSQKVWWKCSKCGKEWQATVASRKVNRYGCPECAKIQQSKTFIKNLVEKKGSLADNMPELTKEWHPTKNGALTPYNITIGSHKKVWWKCSKCGEEWQAEVTSRTLSHAGCPKCAKVQRGKIFTKLRAKERGSLADKIPDLAKEWHPTKNGDLKPTEVTVGSNKKPWWKCSKCGEEWQAEIWLRARGFCKCPHCAKKKTNQLEFDFS